MMFCDNVDAVFNSAMEVTALAVGVVAFALSLIYMLANAFSNPRWIAWAKDEFSQLFSTIILVAFLVLLLKAFCSMDYCAFSNLFSPGICSGSGSFFDGAARYLSDSAYYAHCVAVKARYLMGKVEVAQSYSRWECPLFLCILSMAGTGENEMPYAGASYLQGALGLVMQSALLAFFSAMLNLQFVYTLASGVMLFLLPFGVLFRSISVLRPTGGAIFAVVFSFIVVYPMLLSFFSAAFPIPSCSVPNESELSPDTGFWSWLSGSVDVVNVGTSEVLDLFSTFANLGFYCVFLPNLALAVSIGSAIYAAGMIGGEIDMAHLFRLM